MDYSKRQELEDIILEVSLEEIKEAAIRSHYIDGGYYLMDDGTISYISDNVKHCYRDHIVTGIPPIDPYGGDELNDFINERIKELFKEGHLSLHPTWEEIEEELSNKSPVGFLVDNYPEGYDAIVGLMADFCVTILEKRLEEGFPIYDENENVVGIQKYILQYRRD